MNKDNQNEVINGEETYQDIADNVQGCGATIIGWTPQDGSHYDVLFARFPIFEGTIQGGIQADYLFVSVMRVGAWGFRTDLESSVTGTYIKEKIGLQGDAESEALAELINGVKKHL